MRGLSAHQNRRYFIKTASVGAVGFSIRSLSRVQARASSEAPAKSSDEIVTRTLGRTGLKVPVVSIGCGVVGPGLARAALEAGIVHFDTASTYNAGASETILGNVFKGRPRDSFIVASKIGLPLHERTGLMRTDVDSQRFRRDFRRALEASLMKLQLEYLDILYLYGPSRAEVLGEPMVKDVLSDCRQRGLARFVGVSFHQNEPAMIRGVVEQKTYDVVLTAYNFRQPHRREVEEAIAEAAAAGVGVIAMKTMAGVYWDSAREISINSKAALKWVLRNENVHTTIPGVTSYQQLATNASVMRDPRLTQEEEADLRLGEDRKLSGLYCSQCGQCRAQCRSRLEIPIAMRAYMYARGYGNPDMARELLSTRPGDAFNCRRCSSCAVSCTMGFRVSDRMRDVGLMVSCANSHVSSG